MQKTYRSQRNQSLVQIEEYKFGDEGIELEVYEYTKNRHIHDVNIILPFTY